MLNCTREIGTCQRLNKRRRALILSATFFLYARMLYGKKIQAHHTGVVA